MPSSAANPITTAAPVILELDGYGPEFLAGAAETLGAVWGDLARGAPDEIARQVAERLAKGGPLVDRLRNPEWIPPVLPNGAAYSPLRAAVVRYSARFGVRPDAVDALVARLAVEMSSKSLGDMTGCVVRFLMGPAAASFLLNPPAAPARVRDLAALVMREFGDVFEYDGAMRFAMERANDLRSLPDRVVVGTVSGALDASLNRTRWGVAAALDPSDPRRLGALRDSPARAAGSPLRRASSF